MLELLQAEIDRLGIANTSFGNFRYDDTAKMHLVDDNKGNTFNANALYISLSGLKSKCVDRLATIWRVCKTK